jgi:Tfp pilus assembly protein PilF
LELGRADDAIFWLERATKAPRYECYHYAWFNLGRVFEKKNQTQKAKACYLKAIEICPEYTMAQRAFYRLVSSLN